MVDKRKNVVECQTIELILVSCWNTGNKQWEELIGVGNRTSADEIKTHINW